MKIRTVWENHPQNYNLRKSAESADKYSTHPVLCESLARHASKARRAGVGHTQ